MNLDTQEAQDTAFYAQLTRQILLLMDDEDDVETLATRKPQTGWVRPASDGSIGGSKQFGWLEGGRRSEVRGGIESLWGNNYNNGVGVGAGTGIGTGVFIPRLVDASKPRRKRQHRSRKNRNGGIITDEISRT